MENFKDFLAGFAVAGVIVSFMYIFAFYTQFKNHEKRIENIEYILGEKK